MAFVCLGHKPERFNSYSDTLTLPLKVLAKNQEIIASLIEQAGAAVIIDRHELETICNNLVINLNDLQEFSLMASKVTDGQGTNRVIDRML